MANMRKNSKRVISVSAPKKLLEKIPGNISTNGFATVGIIKETLAAGTLTVKELQAMLDAEDLTPEVVLMLKRDGVIK